MINIKIFKITKCEKHTEPDGNGDAGRMDKWLKMDRKVTLHFYLTEYLG
jgi:hypothetical protein